MPKGILKEIVQPPTLQQRLGSAMALGLLPKSENLPLTPDKLGYYYGALADKPIDLTKPPDPQLLRVAQALIWADIKLRSYRSRCLAWYPLVASAFPDDERSAFYVAALIYHEVLTVEENETERFWGQLMRPAWSESVYWSKLSLSRADLLRQLIDRFQDAAEIRITPERLPILEAAFDLSALSDSQRLTIVRWLAVAYRASGRSDDKAEIVYRYLFLQDPDDSSNNAYLANLFVGRGLDDGNACVVYSRMVSQSEKENKKDDLILWSTRLARCYVSQGRLGVDAIRPLQTALSQVREDRLLEAALAFAISKSEISLHDPSLLKHLETVMAFESEFVPYFAEHQWQWSLVPRALALGWGRLGRRDSLAMFIYGRATELCPEEKTLWGFYASALAEAKDTSPRAIAVYEKAHRYQLVTDQILLALAHAYVQNEPQDANERRKFVTLWETLYRKGLADAEIVAALTDSYLNEVRLTPTALDLLESLASTATVAGPIRLRIAQEWAKREDYAKAQEWYRLARQAMPDHFTVLKEYGLLMKDHFGDFGGAAQALATAVTLPPGEASAEAHFALGECLLALERREDARQIFQRIVERIDPNHTQTLIHLARLNLKFEMTGMLNAEVLFERAAALEPDNPETFKLMADLYRSQGNTRMEQWAMEQYLKKGPQDAQQYRALADLYLRRRDLDKAEAALRQVIALGEGNREVYALLGDIVQQSR